MKPCPTCGVMLAANLIARIADEEDAGAVCPAQNVGIVRKDEK